jgi:hypothetical protein
MYLATVISRGLKNMDPKQIQEIVGTHSDLFDKKIISIFPVKCQPKILLRESSENLVSDYRIYFGYLLPRDEKCIPLSLDYLKIMFGFKHGLILFE